MRPTVLRLPPLSCIVRFYCPIFRFKQNTPKHFGIL
ncbi:hypothetical protein BACCAP_01623 [Pseudoflavonifractor capillosus ATCC 29799]|uniref:Uncharacterized protein n=1 Tax=Pseudoflavonifractor capillosus ATCC 29799 TaxID=411467 RepID=A6NTU4_9FIRM|nr:hypothetical protein BACCAP_01623 [Pseudoflavonifractor capillosus ATCC 29799]